MVWGSALAFGFLGAVLQALRPRPAGFTFQVSVMTFVAFAMGVAIGVVFWRIILNRVGGARQKSVRFLVELLVFLLGTAAFLYPLRFVPADKLPEMFTGLITAACALGLLAGLLILVGRFFESDDRKNRRTSPEEKIDPTDESRPPQP